MLICGESNQSRLKRKTGKAKIQMKCVHFSPWEELSRKEVPSRASQWSPATVTFPPPRRESPSPKPEEEEGERKQALGSHLPPPLKRALACGQEPATAPWHSAEWLRCSGKKEKPPSQGREISRDRAPSSR